MTAQLSKDVLHDTKDAILNEQFEGFKEDYLVIHSLIRRYRPASFFEIGTNMGRGTEVICNAIYKYHFDAKIYSLDLPTDLAHTSLQSPLSEGKGDLVGSWCKLPYTQLRGDSSRFRYQDYPCEGYYIDGEHDYDHPNIESIKVLALKTTKIVIWHDSDIPLVWRAITDAIKVSQFQLFRVTDTRISYALKK